MLVEQIYFSQTEPASSVLSSVSAAPVTDITAQAQQEPLPGRPHESPVAAPAAQSPLDFLGAYPSTSVSPAPALASATDAQALTKADATAFDFLLAPVSNQAATVSTEPIAASSKIDDFDPLL